MNFFTNSIDTQAPPLPDPTGPLDETGTFEAAGKGFMRGAVSIAGASTIAAGGLVSLFDEGVGDTVFRFYDEVVKPSRDFWTPDPESVSTADSIIGGISELGPSLMFGPAAIPALVGTATINTGVDLIEQGVDPITATAVGVLGGAATALMVRIPVSGKGVAQTLGLAATNPLVGALQTVAQGKALKVAGYEDIASSFDPFDPTGRSIDLALGLIFGGMAHYGRARADMPTHVTDAIDVSADAQHVTKTDIIAGKNRVASEDAINSAMDSLTNGEPVDVTKSFAGIGLAKGISNAGNLIKGLEPMKRVKELARTDPQGLIGALENAEQAEILLPEFSGGMMKALQKSVKDAEPMIKKVKPDAETVEVRKAFDEFDRTIAKDAAPIIERPVKKAPAKPKKKPKTLADFMRSKSMRGLNIEKEFMTGEVRDFFSKKEGFGLIDKRGKTFDEATELAYEAGYFAERPTVVEFIDALKGDVDFKLTGRGKQVLSREDVDVFFETENKRLLDEYYAAEEARLAEVQAEGLATELDKTTDPSVWYDEPKPTEGQVVSETEVLGVLVDDYIDANPDTTVGIRYSETGTVKVEKAREVIDEAKAEVATAKKKRDLYEIATECLWRG